MRSREKYLSDYRKGRSNLLMMIGLTVVNIILIYANANLSFPFSATFPQLSILFGNVYFEEYGLQIFAIVGVIISIISLGIYFICYYFSKNHYGFMITALVLFSIDLLILLFWTIGALDMSYLIDIAFHAWVLYYLIIGTRAGAMLRKLPQEEAAEPAITSGSYSQHDNLN